MNNSNGMGPVNNWKSIDLIRMLVLWTGVVLLLAFRASASVRTCEELLGEDNESKRALIEMLFSRQWGHTIFKHPRREVEKSIFLQSRADFQDFYEKTQSAKTLEEIVELVDSFHQKMFQGMAFSRYSFYRVIEMARVVQASLQPAMSTNRHYIVMAGSFPNGKANLEISDVDFWLGDKMAADYRSKNDLPNRQRFIKIYQKLEANLASFLNRPKNFLSEFIRPQYFTMEFLNSPDDKIASINDNAILRGRLPKHLMRYNTLAIRIYADRLELIVRNPYENRHQVILIERSVAN